MRRREICPWNNAERQSDEYVRKKEMSDGSKKDWNDHYDKMRSKTKICKTEQPKGRRFSGRPYMRWAQSWFSSQQIDVGF